MVHHRHVRGLRARTLGSVIALVLLAACVKQIPTPTPQAGTPISMGPVSVSDRVEYWIARDANVAINTIEDAVALEVRLRVDPGAGNSGPYSVAMAPITCADFFSGGAPGWTCTAMLPAGAVDRINAAGNHAITLAAFKENEGQGSSPPWAIVTGGTTPPPPAAPRGTLLSKGCAGLPGEIPGTTCKP